MLMCAVVRNGHGVAFYLYLYFFSPVEGVWVWVYFFLLLLFIFLPLFFIFFIFFSVLSNGVYLVVGRSGLCGYEFVGLFAYFPK